jgi:methionine aminotransferase
MVSFGKTFHVTGWKVGAPASARTFNEEIKKSTSVLVSVNSISQVAISEYLDLVSFMKSAVCIRKKRLF